MELSKSKDRRRRNKMVNSITQDCWCSYEVWQATTKTAIEDVEGPDSG